MLGITCNLNPKFCDQESMIAYVPLIDEITKEERSILVRPKPEESVLTGCKIGDWSFIGIGEFWMKCQANGCQDCMTFVSS